MGRNKKISLKDILDSISGLLLRENDIAYFCYDVNAMREFIKEFKEENNAEAIQKLLIKYEKFIDKKKFILLLVKNHKEYIVGLKERKTILERKLAFEKNEEAYYELFNIKKQIKGHTDNLNSLLKLGKGMEAYLTNYYYDEDEKRFRVRIMDSREIIDNKRVSNYKNLRRFDSIDSYFKSKSGSEGFGMEYAIQSILLTDFYRVFLPGELDDDFKELNSEDNVRKVELGNNIRTMVLENYMLRTNMKTREEIDKLRIMKDSSEYQDLVENLDFISMLPDIKNTLREYCGYLDIDKLLLISAYRFYNVLETKEAKEKTVTYMKRILEGILENLDEERAKTSCDIELEIDGESKLEHIEFSIDDLKECLNRFTEKEYLSSYKIKDYRDKIDNQEISLLDIEPDKIKIIFSKEELENMSSQSQENLMYISQIIELDTEQILNTIIKMGTCSSATLYFFIENEKIMPKDLIELYDRGIISEENIKDFREVIDLSNYLNFDILNKYYIVKKENPDNEEVLNKYNRYVSLYKNVLMAEKTDEEIKEVQDEAIEGIVQNFNDKDYKIAIKDYYQEGLITLDSIIEWGNSDDISYLYDNGAVSLEKIEELVKIGTLQSTYITEIYDKLIWDNSLSQDERVNILIKGYVSKAIIEELYMKTLISSRDLEKLVANGIITEKEKSIIIESFIIEDAEKLANSKDCLVVDSSVKKIGANIYSKDGYTNNGGTILEPQIGKEKYLIDPLAREKLFEKLGAKKVKAKVSETSPFYNYDFYMVLGKDGKKHLNTPVIAERYFVDKNDETEFSINNATYFFQYGDFLVLRNYLNKDTIVKDKKNVVFRSKHDISTDKRKGNWAFSVICNVIKTMLSSDLKEYSKDNQALIILQKMKEIYTAEEIRQILLLEEEIDKGEHTYYIVNESLIQSCENKEENEKTQDDDNEER